MPDKTGHAVLRSFARYNLVSTLDFGLSRSVNLDKKLEKELILQSDKFLKVVTPLDYTRIDFKEDFCFKQKSSFFTPNSKFFPSKKIINISKKLLTFLLHCAAFFWLARKKPINLEIIHYLLDFGGII